MQNIINILTLASVLLFNISNGEDINQAMDFYMRGELSLLEEDLISAENYFNQALSFSPNNPTILLSLLEINIEKRNFINIETILNLYLILDRLDINNS